ncbi:hypothetical protein MJO29_008231 [Puccinia striiformis f. sp. tritici]|uniref:C2H2-type domain-containing protein n=5 Tax=Puccinia striiformis TaxID=27350 RepID=A0A0L0VVA4_9BASI|nr:hypothetical protein Pst134EB_016714 [Puccinia striiformis f. sp. tritici]KAI9602668.1 hypothetical protein H4Q26_001960 [Puccinia striiformis f. sp. tritici PST-130]KNF03208.1 hypothetical protein PSTG_03473 [Puccinia striiformis f. sp. tritici PST-78]POW09960.1 hypothetical protein PSTT_06450 [Puccinia striiformis]KAI7952600.1 hypothetical protein MJO29_008231 [Puccinia striiformis f. sp. tritici]
MEETFKKNKRRLSLVDHSDLPNNSSCPPDQEVGSSSTTTSPVAKSTKQSVRSVSSISYSCDLPPTCNPPNHKPPRFDNPGALESHHRTHHAFTCSSKDCNRIFPSQYFLDLHLNEVHNPILLVQQEIHHTKIFRCFEQSCEKSFSSPKTRRLHLIDFHGYPKTFFFSLPNQGLNNLYKKFGSGVSLIRPDWKARPEGSDTRGSKPLPIHRETSAQDKSKPITDDDSRMSMDIGEPEESHKENNNAQTAIDSVIDSVQQFSFVPRQIQFGKKAGSKSFLR